MIGQRLGHYDVIEKLGEGGMGVVYKAHDAVLNRTVAIKVLPVGKAGDQVKWQRFLQEAQALSALNHPNIVTIYDMVRDGGTDFLVMECIEGRTLEQALSRRGLTVSDTLRYASQLAAALTAAHEARVIHRDLKPGNIMITDKGVAKILDFGLAKLSLEVSIDANEATRSIRRLTEEGSIVGTIAYMSPEQAEGKPIDARSDIFSFGAVLYEMITGQRAFQGDTKVSTLAAILREEPRPMRAFAAGVPAELERIVNRCLRKDPNKRFQHCDDLQIALEELKQESDSGSLIPPPSAREGPRHRKWLIWSTCAIAAIAAIAGWIHWDPKKPAEPVPSALSRLTADSGLTTDPALSPDGKLLAYASDRGNQGDNLDIWLQHVGSGSPVQLTKEAGDESEPAFSPDGSEIAFSSSRGGIYVIPVLGGEPRQLVVHGSRPRFSPDGKWVAFHVAAAGSASGTVLREVWIIPASGGAAKRILPRFADVSYPSWSPDSRYLLLAAAGGPRGPSSSRRWWVAPASGDEPVMVEGRPFPSGLGGSGGAPDPGVWIGDSVVFSVRTASQSNLWRVKLHSGDWRIVSDPERLTFGTAYDDLPSVDANGGMAMSSAQFSSDLWMLPVDAAQGRVTGELQRLTEDPAADSTAAITPDGGKVVFLSNRDGQNALWLRDGASGRLSKVSPPGQVGTWPQISADGRKVSFQFQAPGGTSKYVISDLTNGTMEEAEGVRASWGWGMSPSGEFVVFTDGPSGTLRVMRIRTKEVQDAITQSEVILSPHFSNDERWIAMHVRSGETTRQIRIAPFHFGRSAPAQEWIAVTDGKSLDRDPAWSPDGNVLYWLADRDGVRGIYARKLDPVTKHPVGPEFEVRMFRGTRRSMSMFPNSGVSRPAVAWDRIVFALGERTGNIWMTKLPKL